MKFYKGKINFKHGHIAVFLISALICLTLQKTEGQENIQSVQWIIKPQFDWAWNFNEGAALVKQNGKYGYIKNPLTAQEIEKSYETAGRLIGTVKSIEGKTVIVALKDVNKQLNMGQKLCLYSGEKMIIMRASFPMMTVTKCDVVSGSVKDITIGTKVYVYREKKEEKEGK